MNSISYAITVVNEYQELKRLISFLTTNLRPQDEIVVLFDSSGQNTSVENYLKECHTVIPNFRWISDTFPHHFADWKNKLSTHCTKKWIFNIDADELPPSFFIHWITPILAILSVFDIIVFPRINTVEGITPHDITSYKWQQNRQGWINWPDYQARLYKNNGRIYWKDKVHESLVGSKKVALLPTWLGKRVALLHPKTIDRQRYQNEFYTTF